MKLQEYTRSKNRNNALALLAYQGISRHSTQLKQSGGQNNNYNFDTDTPYGKEQAEQFKLEDEQLKKQQQEYAIKLEQAEELEAKKANASETTQQVLDVIASHRQEATFSLDAICELIITEADTQAIQTFIDYIMSDDKACKAWKAVKKKAKKQKRRAWIEKMQDMLKK